MSLINCYAVVLRSVYSSIRASLALKKHARQLLDMTLYFKPQEDVEGLARRESRLPCKRVNMHWGIGVRQACEAVPYALFSLGENGIAGRVLLRGLIGGWGMQFDLAQNILRHLNENGALAKQAIGAPAFARINRTGDRKHIAVLVKGKLGGDQRSAPLRVPASTTTVPKLKPLMMRLRLGKLCGSGAVPKGNSDNTTPRSQIWSNRARFSGG